MLKPIPVILSAALVSACAPGPLETTAAGIERARAAGKPTAEYDAFPLALFEAQAAVCTQPGQTIVRPSPTEIRCEALLPPEPTAALILEFDGTVEALPKQVSGFIVIAQPDGGFEVIADYFFRVPQREGGVREIRIPNAEGDRELDEIFRLSGGTPT